MSVVYPRFDLAQDVAGIDMAELERTVGGLVQEIFRRAKLTAADRAIFRADLQQEALTWLYEFVVMEGYTWPYAYGAARHRLIRFVIEQIRWRQAGFALEASQQFSVYDHLVESGDYDDSDKRQGGTRLPMQIYARRPTEDAVIAHEQGEEHSRRWVRFERELARIFAGMCVQRYPTSLQRAAAILCESAKGATRSAIAAQFHLDKALVDAVIKHYREQVQHFLDQSPLMQGLIRAEGRLCLLWWDEVTVVTLNSGQKFVVIYPHGAFAIRYRRVNTYLYGKVVATVCVGETIKKREVSLGRVGHITQQRLYESTLQLQAKMRALMTTA